ncbi:cytidine deaminase-like protein [Amylocystis lapponica]|nr:cytidine deaminase-like protein [Amylocystis lapponica]
MFIAIVGTRSSGKTSVEDYLVSAKGFRSVRLLQNDESAEFSNAQHLSDTRSTSTGSGGSASDDFLPDTEEAIHYDSRLSFLTMVSPTTSTSWVPSPPAPRKTFQRNSILWFSSPAELLDHVTRNWRLDFVTVDLDTRELLEVFLTRPFFMVVGVDAPLLTRYMRANRTGSASISLEDFVREHDEHYYGLIIAGPRTPQNTRLDRRESGSALLGLSELVNLRIVNAYGSVPALHDHLDELNLLNPERLRPGWDAYFMQLASLASHRSNCMKRRVGAILVRNKRIVATGYNGTPRGLVNCNEGGCSRCNNANNTSDECVCLHAEENALLEAGRERVGDGAVLYCNTCPCLKCTIKIIQTGVKEVVYNLSYKVDDASAAMFREAGVIIRRHAPPS